MPQITLTQPWAYRTPLATVDYPAGEHDVSDEVAAAALADPAAQAAIIEQETEDGEAPAVPRKASRKAAE